MLHWVILKILLGAVGTVMVFKFRPNEKNTYMSLASETDITLPDKFIFCTSHKQTRMDKKGFYQVYGESNEPWISTKFSIGSNAANSVGLWGAFGARWIYLGEIPEPKLYFWYHMCHQVDTVRGVLSISINGRRMATNVSVDSLTRNKPKTLNNNLVIGKMTKVSSTKGLVEEQCASYVSNLGLFSTSSHSIDSLSGPGCSQEGDLLAWSMSTWRQTGAGPVKAIEEEVASLCSGEGRYTLALPLGMDQEQAVLTCARLGQGRMTVSHSQEELRQFTDWFQGVVPGACSKIWTPYSDQGREGDYVSLEDGSEASFLPWAPGQPNGADTENGVDIRFGLRNSSLPAYYYDENDKRGIEKFICSSCSLARHFSLQLKGLCEHTLLGNQEIAKIKYSLFSPDTVFVVQNRNNHVEYSGWTSSSISYNSDNNIWVFKHDKYKDLRATVKAPAESLFLGTNLWTIHNDTRRCFHYLHCMYI